MRMHVHVYTSECMLFHNSITSPVRRHAYMIRNAINCIQTACQLARDSTAYNAMSHLQKHVTSISLTAAIKTFLWQIIIIFQTSRDALWSCIHPLTNTTYRSIGPSFFHKTSKPISTFQYMSRLDNVWTNCAIISALLCNNTL